MDGSDLRIFQAVARTRSITKAANQLGYVQSNVTARIQQLESELGTILFHRHNRGMVITSSGKQLLSYADQIVGLLDEATKLFNSPDKPSGSLTIGTTQTAGAVRLPQLLTSYYEKYPNVMFSIKTGDSHILMEKLLNYEIDGAFIASPLNHPELNSVASFDEELVIISARTITNLEEAVKRPVLALGTTCSYRDVLEKWLQSRGLTGSTVMEFGTLEAIIGSVKAGLGISLLSRSLAHPYEAEGTIYIHEIPSPFNHLTTKFFIRKASFKSSALNAFIQMLPTVYSS
ncbi:LysR family transcriptional regulator [Bacillus rugosus]|uniref:LysR family transcriptional regulator n=1 Tax=Bacillus rugosus TaxID=2715209 RepID=UPI002DBC7AAD|nr:LysR family transcriptional regulator [Bacillus rugosus]MEC1549883.1 LysR family transcriptional regulator [Bacillus rugosus]